MKKKDNSDKFTHAKSRADSNEGRPIGSIAPSANESHFTPIEGVTESVSTDSEAHVTAIAKGDYKRAHEIVQKQRNAQLWITMSGFASTSTHIQSTQGGWQLTKVWFAFV